jgi:hypothetical protein
MASSIGKPLIAGLSMGDEWPKREVSRKVLHGRRRAGWANGLSAGVGGMGWPGYWANCMPPTLVYEAPKKTNVYEKDTASAAAKHQQLCCNLLPLTRFQRRGSLRSSSFERQVVAQQRAYEPLSWAYEGRLKVHLWCIRQTSLMQAADETGDAFK